jgi:hypothetical protein
MTAFDKALKSIPSGITYDLMEHNTVKDLIFLVQHELDLMSEEPEHFEHLTQSEIETMIISCNKFLKKYRK